MVRIRGWGAGLLALLALAGCGREDAPQPARPAEALDRQFLAETLAWREQRLEELRKPDGWTSLVGLHWLELKAHYIGSSPDSGIRLAVGPAKMGLVSVEGDKVWFTPEKHAALTVDGKPLAGRIRFYSDRDDAPTTIGFDEGKGRLTLIQRGDRRALRVRHADADSRVRFAGLDHWPADPAWRVEARFVPNPAGKTIPIVDIVGITTEQPNAGAVEFEKDGRTYRLEAIGEPGHELFIVFADRTSGHGSYPAGRFIDAGAPDAQGRVVLDFNRAYNPPCAFTPFATCPLPPPENRLDLAVAAGEKNYRKPHAGTGAP
ncbi:DUF1684 domain-containing protein [[Pseudomonas] boreopolis]|uniref:DUF1684 domain-containing protein n=1 Tax=Xanthomonas boreopolis TaxID=86183 RepID=UPI003DA07EBA